MHMSAVAQNKTKKKIRFYTFSGRLMQNHSAERKKESAFATLEEIQRPTIQCLHRPEHTIYIYTPHKPIEQNEIL